MTHKPNKPTRLLIDGEIWRPIKGYEESYEVSDRGRVRSKDRYSKFKERWGSVIERLVKGKVISTKNGDNYPTVQLYTSGSYKSHSVHRLVAEAFIPNPENLPEVNHIDETRINNSVENLEWVSRSGNALHSSHKNRGDLHSKSKLKELDIAVVKRMLYCGIPNKVIADKFNVHHSTISKIKVGKNWRYIDEY